MFLAFFVSAALAPERQHAFRTLVIFHVSALACCFLILRVSEFPVAVLGQCLLTAGIVEGALLLGWRLTQLPKSRALEFLLASPLRPQLCFLAEAAVGLARLALVTLAGLPLLILLAQDGVLDTWDLLPLTLMPLTWGLITGLVLTVWAYEPRWLRRWGERLAMLAILTYLVVGILAAEYLPEWLAGLPGDTGPLLLAAFRAFHEYNPFAVMRYALSEPPESAVGEFWLLEVPALAGFGLLAFRAAWRLQPHYRDRHYSPVADVAGKRRPGVGARPLSWWAIKRVSEYGGKVNLWLAGGFGVLYAAHTLAGPSWPAGMGRQVFLIFDRLCGVEGVAAALMVLAAVPAAFQYGLWDSNTQDRCRRLELLLLSYLDAQDFWMAALAAAWRRGGGYCAVALLLWGSAAISGRITPAQLALALNAGLLMWSMYFALGFRAFTAGAQAGNLGLLLTAGLPLGAIVLFRVGLPQMAALTPPGCVYVASASTDPLLCLPGVLLMALITLRVQRRALASCLDELRHWYEQFHGQKVLG